MNANINDDFQVLLLVENCVTRLLMIEECFKLSI